MDIMKIGILTMHRIVNYGSFMQAYGLKTMIESLGHDVEFVDYVKGPLYCQRSDIKKCFKVWFIQTRFWKRLRKYVRKTVRLSEKETLYREDLKRYLNVDDYRYHAKEDILVIGSDEIFNCLQLNEDVGYSTSLFGKKIKAGKKISYAASFGNTTLEGLNKNGCTGEIGKCLKGFDSISVRDENSHEIVKSLCGLDTPVHLDPVLVSGVEKLKWNETDKKRFVLVYGYSLRFTEEEGKAINEFAHKKGLNTIALGDKQVFCDETIICRPSEVMGYFKRADYVVTDTFHGSIFAIINHKPFATFIRKKHHSGATNSEKLIDMLGRLNLQNKIVEDIDKMDSILETPIDYGAVDEIRETESKRSIEYLRDNLGF